MSGWKAYCAKASAQLYKNLSDKFLRKPEISRKYHEPLRVSQAINNPPPHCCQRHCRGNKEPQRSTRRNTEQQQQPQQLLEKHQEVRENCSDRIRKVLPDDLEPSADSSAAASSPNLVGVLESDSRMNCGKAAASGTFTHNDAPYNHLALGSGMFLCPTSLQLF